jgi:glycosyltransferase involved in cell wall biosynthesis
VTLDLASVRYRALLPVVALSARKVRCELLPKASLERVQGASHLVVVKCFGRGDVALVREAHRLGKRVVFDLCDNIFVEGYGKESSFSPANALHEMAPYLSAIVVPTESLATIVSRQLGGSVPLHTIPDGIESEEVFRKQRSLVEQSSHGAHRQVHRSARGWLHGLRNRFKKTPDPFEGIHRDCKVVLWFGNHGSPWSSFGMSDILVFRDALERVAENANVVLVVVSNNKDRYEKDIKPLAIPSTYVEWRPEVLHRALERADVVIAPSALDDFSICKSTNRTVMALAAGVPVVATPTPALEALRHCVWLAEPYEGIHSYLAKSDLAKHHLRLAREEVRRLYALPVIGQQWLQALSGKRR